MANNVQKTVPPSDPIGQDNTDEASGPKSVLCPTAADDGSPTGAILLVDPNHADRARIYQILAPCGLEVISVSSRDDAIAVLEETSVCLVLTELNLTAEMDGLDFCQEIMADPEANERPVVMITSDARPQFMLAGFDAGASDYLSKSCESVELISRIRSQIEKAALHAEVRRAERRLKAQLTTERGLRDQVQDQQAQLLQNEKLASIGQLAAGVAHEINNPIGFVSSNLNTLGEYVTSILEAVESLEAVLRSAPSSEDVDRAHAVLKRVELEYLKDDLKELIEESVEGTHRIRKIVADLRDFSHVDRPELESLDVNEMFEKTLNVAQSEIRYKAEIVRALSEVPVVVGNGGKLGQVMLNLIINAAQAMESQGTITLRTGWTPGPSGKSSDPESEVWFEVQDTGSGIDAETIGRIFDPFFTTKDVGDGTGLGLHLAYSIVQAHEGRIEVESEVGVGTKFRVTVPVQGPKGAQELNIAA